MKDTNEIINNITNLKYNDYEFEPLYLYLSKLIIEKGFKINEVKTLTNLNNSTGHAYFNGTRIFKRNTLLSILIVIKINLNEINNILKKNNYSTLYAKNEFDFYIIKGLKTNQSINQINNELRKIGKGFY